MTRILILMLGAILTLAGCGGEEGLGYGTPSVKVTELKEGDSLLKISIGDDSRTFSTNGTEIFSKIQNNRSYTVKLSGNEKCGFVGKDDANNDQPTRSATSKNADYTFIVACNLTPDGTTEGDGGSGEEGGSGNEDNDGGSSGNEDNDGGGSGNEGELLLGTYDRDGEFKQRELSLSVEEIAANSDVIVSVSLVVSKDGKFSNWDAPASASFASICAKQELAEIESEIDLDGGQGAASYVVTDPNCKKDTITATVTIEGKQLVARTKEFEISHSQPGSVQFLGADEEKISLKGASAAGLVESAELTFVVKNEDGAPVGAGQEVFFEKINTLGGLSLNKESAKTNKDGEVTVRVSAGTVPHTATIRAKVKLQDEDEEKEILGDGKLAVSVGVITQDAFNLAISELNPQGWDTAGTQIEITAYGADRRGSPADGTIVYFNSKLGNVDPPECTIANGQCSVTWTSHGAQPNRYDKKRIGRKCVSIADKGDAYEQGTLVAADCVNGKTVLPDRYGVNVVTAYAPGEESFKDDNDNNVFDIADPDDSSSRDEVVSHLGKRIFYDYNVTGTFNGRANGEEEEGEDEFHLVPDVADKGSSDKKFYGVGCSEAALAKGHCEYLTQVRRSVSFTLASDNVVGYVFNEAVDFSDVVGVEDGRLKFSNDEIESVDHQGKKTIYLAMTDTLGNAPAAGSEITVDGGALEVLFDTCDTVDNKQMELYVCEAELGPLELADVFDDGDPDANPPVPPEKIGETPADPNFSDVLVTFTRPDGRQMNKRIKIDTTGLIMP